MEGKDIAVLVFNVLGGLGIFLLGMKNMSEGMQAVAGNNLRKMIAAITNNRLIACTVGTLVTMLIQSSSVTTVMVVGMVNAGVMTLIQAIGVILGANIGTTITAWILVLKVGKYGLPILGAAAFFYLFSQRDRVRYTAMLVVGLGMVFFGLELMKDGFAPLSDLDGFRAWFARFEPDSYLGVLKCCAVGAILTAIIQSSSATIGITIAMASQGLIRLDTAVALVLGENIGTTITAWLASLGASTNAKRSAYAHVTFNMLGVAWITLIFPWFLTMVKSAVGFDAAMAAGGDAANEIASRGIAFAHSAFNVTNALLFLPLVGSLEKFLLRITPDKRQEEPIPHLKYLDVRMLDAPAIAIQQSFREIQRMGEGVESMMARLREILAGGATQAQEDLIRKVFHREEVLDILQKEIVEFLSEVLSGNISHDVMDHSRRQLRMADEYESIGDYIESILKLRLKLRDLDIEMTPDGHAEILDLHDHVMSYLQMTNRAVAEEKPEVLSHAHTQGAAITHLMKKYRTQHIERVGNGRVSPLKSLIFTDMLNGYRRIKDHALNIVEVVAGEK